MEYYIGDKRKHIKFDYYIDEGEEGIVFRYGNEAIKIYWENINDRIHPFLNFNQANRMTKIRSKHVLLPRRIVYNSNDEFVGYSTKHISGFYGDREFIFNLEKTKDVIANMPLFLLIDKMKIIYKEVFYLSNKHIILSDINVNSNYIFNGQFWLIDPGCYVFSSLPTETILKINIEKLNMFFMDQVLCLSDGNIKSLEKFLNNYSYKLPDILKLNGGSFDKIKNLKL